MIQTLPGHGRADLIWVDCGPGSFTGTRVGLAAARALALAWDIPVFGFSSMPLIAVTAVGETDSAAVALLGGHGELFVQAFVMGPLAPSTDLKSLPPEAAAHAVRSTLVLGSGAEAMVQAAGGGLARNVVPRAANVRMLPDELRRLPPKAIYVRPPDAKAA